MENGVVVPLFSSATTQENKLNIYAPSRECHECQATKWAVRPFYLKPSKVPAKRSMGVKPRARYQTPNRTLKLACTTWNYHRNHAETPKQPPWKVGSDQDRLENSCPSTHQGICHQSGQIPKMPPVVLKLWESTIDPGLGASDLLKGHFQGLDEVPRILITIPKRMEIDREPYKMLSWPSKVEIKKHKKPYKILGRKHQKARILWKSWDSGIKNLCPSLLRSSVYHAIWS